MQSNLQVFTGNKATKKQKKPNNQQNRAIKREY